MNLVDFAHLVMRTFYLRITYEKYFTIEFISATLFACFGSTFELKNASEHFDIKIKVESCDDGFCGGKASFSFYKKGGTTPYQVINLPDTQIQLDENGNAQANVSMLYDNQSAVNIGDSNFDGMEDVAICDGANGSYGGPVLYGLSFLEVCREICL